MKNELRRRKSFRPYVLLGLLIFFLGVFLIWKLDPFSIKKIDVSVTSSCGNPEDIKLVSKIFGKNIFFIDEKVILGELQRKYPCIQVIKLEKYYPSSILIIIQSRIPKFKVIKINPSPKLELTNLEATPSSQTALLDWAFPSGGQETLISDENGVVFSKDGGGELPTIFLAIEKINIGQQLDHNLFKKLTTIFNKLSELSPEISSEATDSAKISSVKGKIEDNNLLVDSRPRMIFELEKDVLRQLASLQLILQKAKINGREIKTIDLRFDKPVIEYFINSKDGKR
jgi:hypothetical protein